MPEIKIINNDCLIALKEYPDNYFDSVVTDPPYGINFMQSKWDYEIPSVELWKEVLRVLKPGGHILVACGTRTQHRMAVNIEDAGFEIRDIVSWIYGSGFPKALDISKAIDSHLGVEGKIVGEKTTPDGKKMSDRTPNSKNGYHPSHNVMSGATKHNIHIIEPSSDEAKQWDGWKTALKPAQELWTLARKPLSEKTIASNILKWGTGAININGCRIGQDEIITNGYRNGENGSWSKLGMFSDNAQHTPTSHKGRFPANVIFDEEAGKMLDEQSGHLKIGDCSPDGFKGEYKAQVYGKYANNTINPETVYADQGGASRFFYCAKASKSERNKGLEDVSFQKNIGHNRFDKCKTCGKYILQNPDRPSACKCENPIREDNIISGNFHPTVKPIKLLSYLVRLITPPNGIVLDPFNGSGSCGIACKIGEFNYIGIEREKEYCDISEARIKAWEVEKEDNEQLLLF